MIEQGEVWTLADGNKYVVVSVVMVDGKRYVYLTNTVDYKKYLIGEYLGDELKKIDDPDLLETLLVKFNDDLKESLPRIIEKYMEE